MEEFSGEKFFSSGFIDGPIPAYAKDRKRGSFWGQELGANLVSYMGAGERLPRVEGKRGRDPVRGQVTISPWDEPSQKGRTFYGKNNSNVLSILSL
jgi:hypothetical protein